jgi:hypothetical protein
LTVRRNPARSRIVSLTTFRAVITDGGEEGASYDDAEACVETR